MLGDARAILMAVLPIHHQVQANAAMQQKG
jgi:hypothetical protein